MLNPDPEKLRQVYRAADHTHWLIASHVPHSDSTGILPATAQTNAGKMPALQLQPHSNHINKLQFHPMQDTELTLAIQANVSAALAEDLGNGDLTAQLIPADHQAQATLIAREAAVLCGRPWFEACFKALDPGAKLKWHINEGAEFSANITLCEISGNARAMLSAERPALNFLQTLSGVASITRRYVQAIAGTGALIMDTRKTLPGLRLAQKYAVKIGGGANQRIGLFDGVLIKENHIAAAGSIATALAAAQQQTPSDVSIQI